MMRYACVVLMAVGLSAGTAFGQFSLLHSFDAGADGWFPRGQLAYAPAAGTLFGTCQYGGAEGPGVIYRIEDDGTGFQVLHEFEYYPPIDGNDPYGQPVWDPVTGRLYGATRIGGGGSALEAGSGVVWAIDTDGDNYEILHRFRYSAAGSYDGSDGSDPYSMPIIAGGVLYGTTISGGTGGAYDGTLYRINIDGTGYARIRNFSGGATDGYQPYGPPTYHDGLLYGLTNQGGAHDDGVLYRVNTNGTGFAILHDFEGSVADDGQLPFGNGLVVTDQAIYGMTQQGGVDASAGVGTLFKCDIDGGNFEVLHVFEGSGESDGGLPDNSLFRIGDNLFGMTRHGGLGGPGKGIIFRYDTGTDEYEILHTFAGGADDGEYPYYGSLVADVKAATFFGTTEQGGANDDGTVFKLTVSEGHIPEPATLVLLGLGGLVVAARARRRR